MSSYPHPTRVSVLSMSDAARTRFYSKIRIGAPDECHEWTAFKSKDGYGRFRAFGGHPVFLSHRVAYSLHHGVDLPCEEVGKPTCVLHTCDNPSCCNPRHLWLGSRVDNNRDRARKGRNAPVRNGEKNNHAVLCSDDVRAIRRLFYDTFGSIERTERTAEYYQLRKKLAVAYGVTWVTIYHILTRSTWKHLPTPW